MFIIYIFKYLVKKRYYIIMWNMSLFTYNYKNSYFIRLKS